MRNFISHTAMRDEQAREQGWEHFLSLGEGERVRRKAHRYKREIQCPFIWVLRGPFYRIQPI